MTARVSIFSLSPKAVENLLLHLEVVDLFQISQLSKRALAFVKKTVRLSDQKFSLFVVFSSSSKVTLHRKVNDDVQWKFHGNRDPERYELDKYEQRVVKIDNDADSTEFENLTFVFYRRLMKTFACASDSIEDVLKFTQYFAQLFNANTEQLTLKSSQLHNLKSIQSLSLLRKCKRVIIENGTVSHEEMRRILERFECEDMRIQCNPEPNFNYDYNYDLPISTGHLQIGNGEWFNGSMLLKLDCQHLIMTGCSLTDEDVNKFLMQWEQDSNEVPRTIHSQKHCLDLESFDVYRSNDMLPWNLDRITRGLNCTRHPLPSKPSEFSTTVHREMDDRELNLMIYDEDDTLVIQSDSGPCDASTCPLKNYMPSLRQRFNGFQ